MITIENKIIANIKSLVIETKENKNKPLPTVIFYHGFESAKENNLTFAYLLAKEQYRVILPYSIYYGERSKNLTIKNELTHDGLILDNRIGVSGTSMGGITTASLLKQYDWIKTGVVLMGSPNLVDFGNLLIKDFNKTAKNQISLNEKEKVLNQLK